MALELFPYQKIGAEFLASKRHALLADKQRLGKTAQAVTAADAIKATRILVVCKAIARFQWVTEWEKFSTRKAHFSVWEGSHCTQINPHTAPVSVVIHSYEGAVATPYHGASFDLLIIDESHSLKEPRTERTQKIFGRNGLCRIAKRVWCLTGTPTPNALASELWTHAYTFGATSLGYEDFLEKFCLTHDAGFGKRAISTKNDAQSLRELHTLMSKFMLRRTEQDVSIELPKMSFSTVEVPPGRLHLSMDKLFLKYVVPYDRTKELEEELKKELGVVENLLNGNYMTDQLVELLKAHSKSISTLRRYTALQKLEPATGLIAEELEAGAYRKCVIFAHHKAMIEGARIYLERFKPVTLYGGSNPLKVEENLRKFKDPNNRTRVFIGNILAAGTSIDLSVANHIFFLEESFVPGDNMQAAMRCGGPNQKNPVFVRNFCLANSFDRRVQEIIREKMRGLSAIYQETPPVDAKDLF